MKHPEENKIIYNKPTKNGNSFYTSKSDRETVSSPIDETLEINSSNNYISIPQDLQDNLPLINNSIDILDKFIDATVFHFTEKINNEKKN